LKSIDLSNFKEVEKEEEEPEKYGDFQVY